MRFILRLFLIVFCISTKVAKGEAKSERHLDTRTSVVIENSERSDFFFGKSDHLRPKILSTAEVYDMEPLVDSAYI
jgi:hypothetical protein